MTRRAPVIALSHGGGPMPLLGDPNHEQIVSSLRNRVPELLKLGTPEAPRAIVLVTAHWSERNPTISCGERTKLYFDYYNFPEETYKYKYDAAGSPEVAQEVAERLREFGLEPELDDERGWDHGVFIPMMLVNPSASVPIVQMSVLDSEDPDAHFRMGQALSALRDDNIAIIGSGFATFHNLRIMRSAAVSDPSFRARNDAWSEKIADALGERDVGRRGEKLRGWRQFPGAYDMHPRGGAEHFLPLVVCAGAGGEAEAKNYSDSFYGLAIWSYYWD